MPELIDEQRLIDASSLINTIMEHEISMNVCMTQDELCGMAKMRRMIIEDIVSAPTVEAEPVRHRRWIMLEPYGALHTQRRKCSECGEIKAQELTNFCPNCGARMNKGEQNEEI